MIYGALPEDLGLVNISPTEMMFWMYCPIQTPGERLTLPPNLTQFHPVIAEAYVREGVEIAGKYVYLTAKTLWVSGDHIGTRPGWHADGFGTDDVNYIWYDRAPTEFIEDSFPLPGDCADAMAFMEMRAAYRPKVTYPAKHVLRLTPEVIHRPPVNFEPGMRSFVKVSVSRSRYNLEGNSINHGLRDFGPTVPRKAERNHPSAPLEDSQPLSSVGEVRLSEAEGEALRTTEPKSPASLPAVKEEER
jgi:hypothetical protein